MAIKICLRCNKVYYCGILFWLFYQLCYTNYAVYALGVGHGLIFC